MGHYTIFHTTLELCQNFSEIRKSRLIFYEILQTCMLTNSRLPHRNSVNCPVGVCGPDHRDETRRVSCKLRLQGDVKVQGLVVSV